MSEGDFATCASPDQLIQRAWDAGHDRPTVLREGADAARLLLAGERDELATLFWPVPRRLEAIAPDESAAASLRPFASVVVPACLAGGVLARFGIVAGATAIVGAIAAVFLTLGFLTKVFVAKSLQHQRARLDHDVALTIVLDALRAGMRRNPARIPRACEWIRRGLRLPGP